MSINLKRLLNPDDDDVVYSPLSSANSYSAAYGPRHGPYSASLASEPGSACSTYPRTFPFPSPTALTASPTDDYADVPVIEEAPSREMNDVLVELVSGVGLDGDPSFINNLEATESSFYDFSAGLDQWAADTMASMGQSSQGSPTQTTPAATTPSLIQDSSASTAATTEDEEPAALDLICYGMINRVDVKLVGNMQAVDGKLTRAAQGSAHPVQRFVLMEQPEHILLSFADDETEFGYLRPNMTRALDELLRNPALEFEAITPTGALRDTIGRAKKPAEALVKVDINIYGPRALARDTGDRLSERKQWLQRPEHIRQRVVYENPHVISFPGLNLGDSGAPRDVHGREPGRQQPRRQLHQLVTGVLGSLQRSQNLNRVQRVGSQVTGKLLAHQEEAQDFMRQRESGEIPDRFRLWKPKMVDGVEWFYHAVTNQKSRNRPDEEGGGILADEMGMGKSLSILTLIVDSINDGQDWADQKNSEHAGHRTPVQYSRSTLVVVSSALLINNWVKEVGLHLQGSLKVLKYHGLNREEDLRKIEDSDIVLTTYNTLAAEFSDKRSRLHKIGWWRVVLDEAHIIRRQATLFHRSCADLEAKSRWCLTGTPIQNKLEDIGALFAFIRAKPFHSIANFRRYIQTPFEQSEETNAEKVQERLVMLFDSLVLRRTKEVLHLPNLQQRVRQLDLSPDERVQYENTKRILARIIRQRAGVSEKNNKFGLFQANLQMRIMCNHGTYQQPFSWQRRSYRDEREAAACAIGGGAEITCSGCQQPMPVQGSNRIYNSFVEVCNHVLCSECLDETETETQIAAGDGGGDGQERHCPICLSHNRAAALSQAGRLPDRVSSMSSRGSDDVEMTDVSQNSSTREPHGEEDDDHYFRSNGHSTKMDALVTDVQKDLADTKSIIFSCWTRTLNLVAKHLERVKIPYLRIDGECPLIKRQSILDEFSRDETKPVLIMTTGTGAFGLNLTCANRVFIVELQWNPSVENQAIARAIRLGQDREVLVTRYVIKNSIEEEMQSQQLWKLKMGEMGFEDYDVAKPGEPPLLG